MATKDEEERQFIADAVIAAKAAKEEMIRAAHKAGTVVDITDLRKLDMDIKTCEDELRRSA